MPLLQYPLYLLKFWYVDATMYFLQIYRELLKYCLSLFSLPLLIHTFFKPVKNEYRKDLVLFSIFFGMGVKSVLISISLGIMLFLSLVGAVFLVSFWALPYFLYQLISL